MSCKDKQKFKTSEASSKASLRSKGAIDKFLNILDVNMFNKLNKKWTTDAIERFDIEGKLFYNDNNKVVANKVAFKKIDNAKGINYQNTQSVSDQGIIASEKTIRDLAAKIADRIGMTVKFESDRSKKYKGKIENNVAYVNLAYATLDTPIHEILGHPIIRAIKDRSKNQEDSSFNKLYENLLEELSTTQRGKEVLDRIKRDYKNLDNNILDNLILDFFKDNYKNVTEIVSYKEESREEGFGYVVKAIENSKSVSFFILSDKLGIKNNTRFGIKSYSLEEQQEEAIVELLGLMTAEKLNNVKDGKLISLLKRLLKEMKQFIRSLINQKEVEIDKLPDNMTIGDLSDLLAYSNSKLILPGYEVEYTTPDNNKFKTYQEASNHIGQLAKNVKDVDLDNIKINPNLEKEVKEKRKKLDSELLNIQNKISEATNEINNFEKEIRNSFGDTPRVFTKEELSSYKELKEKLNLNFLYEEEKRVHKLINEIRLEEGMFGSSGTTILNFIQKNKEYEQSKEIVEEWKKVNNIQYNPEEIYSRGQEFSSVVGAYSEFDVNLMMQNLLSHIEDNEKAGGQFAISAYTKPIDKQIGHLEGGGGKIKFKLYPQSNDILWAANTDVYSGSVWDASEKVNKDKKSELLGVSYTKYPSLRSINTVQPNLASIVDNLAHHHNELGIVLTGNNFRLEYDEDIPYTTKKIIDGINKILEQKYGELVKPEINKNADITLNDLPIKFNVGDNIYTKESGEWLFYDKNGLLKGKFIDKSGEQRILNIYKNNFKTKGGIQPTQTNETLKESIESIKKEYLNISYDNYYIHEDGSIYEPMPDDLYYEENQYEEVFDENGEYLGVIEKSFKSNKKEIRKFREDYEKNQALINTKIAALKEVAKKQPRSLIRSEVKPINRFDTQSYEQFSELEELPFQKVPSKENEESAPEWSTLEDENAQPLVAEPKVNRRVETDSEFTTVEDSLGNFIKKALDKLEAVRKRTQAALNHEHTPDRELYLANTKALIDEIASHEYGNRWKAIIGYTSSFAKTINHVNKLLNELSNTYNLQEDDVTELVEKYSDYLKAYDMLGDIQQIASKTSLNKLDLSEEELEDFKSIQTFLDSFTTGHQTITDKFLEIKRQQAIRIFSDPKYNTEVETKHRKRLELEYKSLEDKDGMSKNEFISKMLNTRDADDFKADLKASAEKRAFDPSMDITSASGLLSDNINTNNRIMQIINNVLSEARGKVVELFMNNDKVMFNLHKALVAEKGNLKPSELYKNFFESDSTGKRWLKGRFSVKFKEELEAIKKEVRNDHDTTFKVLEVQENNLSSIKKGNKTISLRSTGSHNIAENDTTVITVNNIKTGLKVRVNSVTTYQNFNELSDQKKDDFARAVGNYEDFADFLKSNDYADINTEKAQNYPEIYNFINGSGSMDIISYEKVGNDLTEYKKFSKANGKFNKWMKENTVRVVRNGKKVREPAPKFANQPLSKAEQKLLNAFIKINRDNDINFKGQGSLVTKRMGAEYYELPSISKSDLERRIEGDIKGLLKDKWTDFTEIKSDDVGIQGRQEAVDSKGQVIRDIKVHYRGVIEADQQSLDLTTMYRKEYFNGINYASKREMKPKLTVIADVVKGSQFYKRGSFGERLKNKFAERSPEVTVSGESSEIHKRIVGLIDRTLYDTFSSYGGTLLGKDINKITSTINGYAAGIAMSFNLASGVANAANGFTQLFIESVGNDKIKKGLVSKAEAKYGRALLDGSLLKDLTNPTKSSYFNQLLEKFDVMGGLDPTDQESIRNTFIRKFGSTKMMNVLNQGGEHMMHSILTEAILDGIKVMNSQSQYIDKDGNITTQDKAASLVDMMYMNQDGVLTISDKVIYSDFNLSTPFHEGGKTHIDLLIKKKTFDIFGVYDVKFKNEMSKHWLGKMAMMFKNFFISGAQYRYTGFGKVNKDSSDLTDDDMFYNSAEKEYIEGTYTTLGRFLINTVIPNLKSLKLMYMKENYENLSDYEKSNLKKATMEIALTMVILPSVGYLLGALAAAGDDDDDALWFAIYVNRRLIQELSQFRNPIEAGKLINNPVAGSRFVNNLLDFTYDIATPINIVPQKNESFLGYLDKNSKGENKMVKHGKKLIPIWAQLGKDYQQLYGLQFGK